MRDLLCVCLAVCALGTAHAGKLPSFIQPCSQSDPNLNQCVSRVIRVAGPKFAEGVPELGIEALDPINLGRININNPALKIVFTDTVVTGLKTFKLNHFKMNTEKRQVVIDFTANVTLKAQYTIDGQILILPIRGEGPAKIKLTNLNIIVTYDYDVVKGEDGQDHWSITKYTDTYKMERAVFKFQNLFGGKNKELSNTIHLVVNESWSLVIKDIAPPAIEEIISACVKLVGKFYSVIPVTDIILP